MIPGDTQAGTTRLRRCKPVQAPCVTDLLGTQAFMNIQDQVTGGHLPNLAVFTLVYRKLSLTELRQTSVSKVSSSCGS